MSEPITPEPALTRRARREAREAAVLPLSSAADADGREATILTVCTGNICRSPMAEVLLRSRLPRSVKVHSAGTQAMVGYGMTTDARDLAVELGAEPNSADRHSARYLVEPILAESDLVLTMTREHRTRVVQMLPSLIRRTFTLREFARLAAELGDEEAREIADDAGTDAAARLSALARAVGALRGSVAASAEEDDVIDPYRRGRDTYELSASQLVPALTEVERLTRIAVAA